MIDAAQKENKAINSLLGLAQKLQISPKHKVFAVPGVELGLPDSESGVLTTTLYRKFRLVQTVHLQNIRTRVEHTFQGICWI